jgi:hypothetical protein
VQRAPFPLLPLQASLLLGALGIVATACGGGSGASEPVDAEGVPLSWGLVEIGEEIASFPPFEGPPVVGRARHLRLSGDAMLVAEAMDGMVHRFGLDGTHLGSCTIGGTPCS